MKYGLLFIAFETKKRLKKKRSLCYKFIWQRPIYSFHRVEWAGDEDLLARQLNTFDAALSPSIMALLAWNVNVCTLAPTNNFYVDMNL